MSDGTTQKRNNNLSTRLGSSEALKQTEATEVQSQKGQFDSLVTRKGTFFVRHLLCKLIGFFFFLYFTEVRENEATEMARLPLASACTDHFSTRFVKILVPGFWKLSG